MRTTEKLIEQAEREYGFRVASRLAIKSGVRESLVAKLTVGTGESFVLKGLFEPPGRQRFIVESERLLAERGVPLARPKPTKDGRLFILHEGAAYALYEWVPGDGAPLDTEKQLLDIARLAGRLHRASRGLPYPDDVERFGHVDWRQEYEERLRTMERWRETYGEAKDGKKGAIARRLPRFLAEGRMALHALRGSEYEAYRDGRLDPPTLVHGDLHNNNVLCPGGARKLIDFEDVRFDAPSKDLLRIYSMYTKSRPFEAGMLRRLLRAYERANPLSRELRRIVRIDLWFPHIFERMLRKKTYRRMDREQLDFFLEQEGRKAEFIRKRYFAREASAEKGGIA